MLRAWLRVEAGLVASLAEESWYLELDVRYYMYSRVVMVNLNVKRSSARRTLEIAPEVSHGS